MIDRIQRLAFRVQPPRHIARRAQRKREAAGREFERDLWEAMKNETVEPIQGNHS